MMPIDNYDNKLINMVKPPFSPKKMLTEREKLIGNNMQNNNEICKSSVKLKLISCNDNDIETDEEIKKNFENETISVKIEKLKIKEQESCPIDSGNAEIQQLSTYNLCVSSNINLNLTEEQIKNVLTSPIPKGQLLECNILQRDASYFVYINNTEKCIMSAHKIKRKVRANYNISYDHDKCEENYLLGKLNANLLKTEYILYDGGKKPNEKTEKKSIRKYYAEIRYDFGVFGNKGYRKFSVYTPDIDMKKNIPYEIENINKAQDKPSVLYPAKDSSKVLKYSSRIPEWSKKYKAYVINYDSRVTQVSIKNFQLVSEIDMSHVLLHFGRASTRTYVMNFEFPFTPVQAFGISLSSIDNTLN